MPNANSIHTRGHRSSETLGRSNPRPLLRRTGHWSLGTEAPPLICQRWSMDSNLLTSLLVWGFFHTTIFQKQDKFSLNHVCYTDRKVADILGFLSAETEQWSVPPRFLWRSGFRMWGPGRANGPSLKFRLFTLFPNKVKHAVIGRHKQNWKTFPEQL